MRGPAALLAKTAWPLVLSLAWLMAAAAPARAQGGAAPAGSAAAQPTATPVAPPAGSAATPPPASRPRAETAQPEAPDSFFEIIFSGGLVGLPIILLLAALSLTAAYLVFEHLMTLRRSEVIPEGLGDAVRQHLQAGRLQDADQACRAKPSFLSFVLLNGLAEIEGGWSAVEKALEDATAEQSARLFRKIEYLSVIGNIAPMVGLLGTVTGMIFAFQQVASTQGAAGAGELAEGIYQALVTTVGGLIVAIPALGAFAIFRNWVDQLVAEAAYMAQHAFTPLKRRRSAAPPAPRESGKKAAGSKPAATPPPPPPTA